MITQSAMTHHTPCDHHRYGHHDCRYCHNHDDDDDDDDDDDESDTGMTGGGSATRRPLVSRYGQPQHCNHSSSTLLL